MNILLGIRDRNAGLVKALFDGSNYIPAYLPEIAGFGPGTADEVYGGVCQFIDFNHRLGFSQHQRMLAHSILKDLLCLVDIVTIADTENHIEVPFL